VRVFGIALLASSVLLGSGGVMLQRSAHAETPVSEAQPEMCRSDSTPNGVESVRRHTRLAEPQGSPEVIVLGARGFNYLRPGDPVPTAVRAVEPGAAPPAAAGD